MRTLLAWLRLIRIAALPTALADVWLGTALVDQLQTRNVVWLSLLSLAFYAAGMILNDVHDAKEDRTVNPGRPIPAGQISTMTAGAVGAILLALAVSGAALLGTRPLAVAAFLAALILAYDFFLKATAFGPAAMGLCRSANVVLGMSCVPPAFADRIWPNLIAAAPVFIYIAGVSALARTESGRRSRPALLAASLAAVATACLLFLLMRTDSAVQYPGLRGAAVGSVIGAAPFSLLVLLALAIVLVVIWAVRNTRRAVTLLLIGVIPLQAIVALAHIHFFSGVAAVLILLLLVPVLLLRLLSHIT